MRKFQLLILFMVTIVSSSCAKKVYNNKNQFNFGTEDVIWASGAESKPLLDTPVVDTPNIKPQDSFTIDTVYINSKKFNQLHSYLLNDSELVNLPKTRIQQYLTNKFIEYRQKQINQFNTGLLVSGLGFILLVILLTMLFTNSGFLNLLPLNIIQALLVFSILLYVGLVLLGRGLYFNLMANSIYQALLENFQQTKNWYGIARSIVFNSRFINKNATIKMIKKQLKFFIGVNSQQHADFLSGFSQLIRANSDYTVGYYKDKTTAAIVILALIAGIYTIIPIIAWLINKQFAY